MSGKQLKGLVGKQLKELVGIVMTEVVVAPGAMRSAAAGVGRLMQPACPNWLQVIDCFEEAVYSWFD